MSPPESLIAQAFLQASAAQAHMFAQLLRGEPTSCPPAPAQPPATEKAAGEAEQRVRAWVSRRLELFPGSDLINEISTGPVDLNLTMSDLSAVLDTLSRYRALLGVWQ